MNVKLILFLLSCAVGMSAPYTVNVPFDSLTLRNGRALKSGVIKSYDPSTGRVVIQAGRELSSCQIEMLPESEAARVVSLAPSESKASEQEKKLQQRARAEAEKEAVRQRAARNERDAQLAQTQAAQARASRSSTPAQPAQDPLAVNAKRLALDKADRYYRYEFRPASGSVLVVDQGVRVDEPVSVPGWDRRYRVQGTVGLQFYDSRGRSFDRTTRSFEVLVGPDSNGHIVVLDFTAK